MNKSMAKVCSMDCGIIESWDASHSDELANFECNICFELPREPIVTLCGHLYCWPCLVQWLRLHSKYHECPICKSRVHEEELIPIYGRGKPKHDPRSRSVSGINITNQETWQQMPQTPYAVAYSSPEDDELDPILRLMPMAAARFGHTLLSALFEALQFRELSEADMYGSTDLFFHSSIQGDIVRGEHHLVKWKSIVWKVCLALLGLLIFCVSIPLMSFRS
ncbi:E3 ubiquitin-protein ligase RMA3-like [Andrographis paniculata]|uniref:E3 ubiquitin-protein ligase RMA3-like n=1 Tax=Andrographis paniculata TaxID=175694 RepID=UPI0021E7C14B|nr:E3 ubiquitin-protein ligase RMA3-like [Andrographis paniculata]XP_051144301.1 E3 ubiquitin-protein ligase RMA3-like [Andrographis paniculata]